MREKLTTKIKEFRDEIKEMIDEWKVDTLNYTFKHPYTSGFFIGTAMIWSYIVIAAKITGKVWDLVEKKK